MKPGVVGCVDVGGGAAPSSHIHDLVRRIPCGRVMTYGQIADHLASEDLATLTARQVGRAMGEAPEDVPWHRVVNAGGRCSVDTKENPRQQRLLESEGVVFRGDRLRLVDVRWAPAAVDVARELP